MGYEHEEFVRKPQLTQKINISSTFINNIDGSHPTAARSSFGSSTRSNSSSTGTNNSVSSRESTSDIHNIHTAYMTSGSPNISLLENTLTRSSETENPTALANAGNATLDTIKPGGFGNEYFLLNGWNSERNKRDARGKSGSSSSFSSSNGSGGNGHSSNRSLSSEEKRMKKKTAQNSND